MKQIPIMRSALAAARFEEALKRIQPDHPWLKHMATLPELKETKQ